MLLTTLRDVFCKFFNICAPERNKLPVDLFMPVNMPVSSFSQPAQENLRAGVRIKICKQEIGDVLLCKNKIVVALSMIAHTSFNVIVTRFTFMQENILGHGLHLKTHQDFKQLRVSLQETLGQIIKHT